MDTESWNYSFILWLCQPPISGINQRLVKWQTAVVDRDSRAQVKPPELQPQGRDSALQFMDREMRIIRGEPTNAKYPKVSSGHQECQPQAWPQTLSHSYSHDLSVTTLSSGSDMSFLEI